MFATIYFKCLSKISIAKSTFSSVMHNGGEMRRMFPLRPLLPSNSPLSFIASKIVAHLSASSGDRVLLLETSSTKLIRPFPRTSPTIADRSLSSPRSCKNRVPTFCAFCCNFSSSITSSTASPEDQVGIAWNRTELKATQNQCPRKKNSAYFVYY